MRLAAMANRKREPEAKMKVIPRFLYNPEKAERGLKAMADILAGALRRSEVDKVGVGPRSDA